MADKCIGKLTLDISDINKKVQAINDALGSIGKGAAVKISIADEVKKQISQIYDELQNGAKKIAESAQQSVKAIESIGKAKIDNTQAKKDIEDREKLVEKATQAFIKWQQAVTKVTNLEQAGKVGTEQYANAVIAAEKAARAFDKFDASIKREAASEREAAQATELLRQSKINLANATKTKEIDKATQAYIRMREAQTEVWKLEQQGKINTEQYEKAIRAAGKAADEYYKYSNAVRALAANSKEAHQAVGELANIKNAVTIEKLATSLKEYYTLSAQANTALGNKQDSIFERNFGDAEKKLQEVNAQLHNLAMNSDSVKEAFQRSDEEGFIELRKTMNELRSMVEGYKDVADAKRKWQDAADKRYIKEEEQEVKNAKQAIDDYAAAQLRLLKAKTELNNQLARGEIKENTAQYQEAQARINKLAEDVQRAASVEVEAAAIHGEASRAWEEGTRKIADAQYLLKQSELNLADAQRLAPQKELLDSVKQKYTELTDAIRRYNAERQLNDKAGMATSGEKINSLAQELNFIERSVQASNMEADIKQQILNITRQCATAEEQFHAGLMQSAGASGDLESQITGLLTRMFSIMAVIRTINGLIRNTVEYVSQYSNKMNEIQMITMASSSDIEALATRYRSLAEELNASSLDIADAAIYFTRQGLQTAEIEKRLKNVTMYAKAANVEFTQASEILTAVINSMGLVEQEAEDGRNAAQRVADVFLAVGDSAATSGQEIGEAMQKAAASAGAFGMDFEWLASYIATVSETTRQEARTIGTAFNTIIARLHQIKQKGFNEEDETKINDVAKALAKIDVALMDQYGEWRDMDVIFQEIGEKWGMLDGKTKSYIATTMAGVKQQNVFLALMNDLGKGIEGGSRAWELYKIAMESAGTAEEKYTVYRDSVAAAQERLNIAQEKFYSLMNSSIIKSWYDALAGVINMITKGAEATNGLNIIIPVLIGGVTALVLMFIKLASSITAAGGAAAYFAKVMNTNPILLAVTAIVTAVITLTTAISALSGAIGDAKQRMEAADSALQDTLKRIESLTSTYNKAQEMFKSLGDSTNFSSGKLSEFEEVIEELCSISPSAKKAMDDFKAGLIDSGTAAQRINEELEQLIDNEHRLATAEFITKLLNTTPSTQPQMQLYADMTSTWDPGWYRGSNDSSRFQSAFASAFLETKRLMDTKAFGKMISWLPNSSMLDEVVDNYDSERYMPEELYKIYLEAFNTAKENAKNSGLEDAEIAQLVAQQVYQEYFGQWDTTSAQKVMEQEVESMVDSGLQLVAYSLDNVDKSILKTTLMRAVFGEDDELSPDEYLGYAQRLGMIFNDILTNGVENYINPQDVLLHIAGKLFGPETSSAVKELISKNPELAGAINDAYKQLISAGFDDEDIKYLLDGVPIEEWANMVEMMFDSIASSLDELFEDDGGLEGLIGDLFGDADFETLGLLNQLAQADVTFEQIKEATQDSGSIDEYKAKLRELAKTMGVDVSEAGEEGMSSFDDFVKSVKESAKELDKIDEILEAIANHEDIGLDDLMDLSKSHPELLAMVGDLSALEAELQKIKQAKLDEVIKSISDAILDSEDIAKRSPFADMIGDDFLTLREYQQSLAESSEEYAEVAKYIEEATFGLLAATGNLSKVSKDKLLEWQELLFGGGNVDLANRPVIDARMLTERGWEDAGEGIATLFSSTFSAGYGEGADWEWHQNIVVDITPITPDGEVLSPGELESYLEDLLARSANVDELMENDRTENGGKGLLIKVRTLLDDESFEEALKSEGGQMEALHKIQEALYDVTLAEENWIATQLREQAVEKRNKEAEDDNYIKKLKAMKRLLQDGDILGAMDYFNGQTEGIQKGIVEQYEDIAEVILEIQQLLANEEFTDEDLMPLGESLFTALSVALARVPTDKMKELSEEVKSITSEIDTLDEMIKKLEAGESVDFDKLLDLASAHPEILSVINDLDALKKMLEEIRGMDNDERKSYFRNMVAGTSEFMLSSEWADKYDPDSGINTLWQYAQTLDRSSEEFAKISAYIEETVNGLVEASNGFEEATENWLQAQANLAEANANAEWAKSTGYAQQIGQLQGVYGEGTSTSDMVAYGEEAYRVWSEFDEAMQSSIAETYPGVLKAMAELDTAMKATENREEKVAAATAKLARELEKAQKAATAKHFREVYEAILSLEKGAISATEAYEVYDKQVEKARQASQEIVDVEKKMSEGTKATESDVSALAEILGISADKILEDWPSAVAMFDDLTGKTGALREALDALNAAAFIRITGTSEADFTALQQGLISVQGMSEATIALLEATGQWQVETRELDTKAWVQNKDGSWDQRLLTGYQQILVPTGNNPLKRRSGNNFKNSKDTGKGKGGGGGGGGDKGKGNEQTEVEKMLDYMSKVKELSEWQQSYYQSQQKFFSSTGQLQGVIAYLEQERKVLEDQNKTLEENLKWIKEQIDIKTAELSQLSETDEKYEEVADDLEKLKKAYYSYTKELVDNEAAINDVTKSIEEQQKAIRDMEIDIRQTIYQAIEDRERRRQESLNAQVEMENTILDILKRRYEKERDDIVSTTNLKIDALRKERDLLSEQLELRKKQAEQEDKAKRLEELELQYQRIVADPTRAKEAQEIQQQIADLREDMAWDAAEEEVKAQQDSIDQQIESLDEYLEYIQNFYDDIFEHPEQLIAQMNEIMSMTDEEIIAWLQENDENYLNSTTARRQQITEGWQTTLDTMRGTIRTYWDEVEEIIAQGDDYIIQFLMENSDEYRRAGRLQAEKFVEEWKKKLEELRKALEEVAAEIPEVYDITPPDEDSGGGGDSGGSGGGGGGGGGGGSGGTNNKPDGGKDYNDDINNQPNKRPSNTPNNRPSGNNFKSFASGGLAKSTGIAWIDGTPQAPERVLSPYQTQLFETMIKALERMNRVSIPTFPNFGEIDMSGNGGVSVGDIIVNVDNLDTDDDYEELAKKVSDVLMERIGRTNVVGGIRIESF